MGGNLLQIGITADGSHIIYITRQKAVEDYTQSKTLARIILPTFDRTLNRGEGVKPLDGWLITDY